MTDALDANGMGAGRILPQEKRIVRQRPPPNVRPGSDDER